MLFHLIFSIPAFSILRILGPVPAALRRSWISCLGTKTRQDLRWFRLVPPKKSQKIGTPEVDQPQKEPDKISITPVPCKQSTEQFPAHANSGRYFQACLSCFVRGSSVEMIFEQ